MLDYVPGAWFFTRQDGSFAHANRGAAASLGYTYDELMQATIFDIDPTMTKEIWAMLWVQTPPTGSNTIRVRHRRKDGSTFPVEVRASRVWIEGQDLAVSYTVDLTASENTERINRRLLAAIQQTSEAVVVTDARGIVEYVNPAYERATGHCEADVCGKPWLSLEARDDTRLHDALEQVLSQASVWQGRIRSQRNAGDVYDEEVSLSPLRNESAQLVGCVAVKRDVTQQLQLEQQLVQAQRVEAVGQLAGGIAHDFNNLLQVICAQAQLMRLRGAGPAYQPMLNEIANAVERASNLVGQLLAFSRKGTVEFSQVRLDQLVFGTHQMLKPLLSAQIELLWHNSAGAVHVRGNAPQLEQVVVNLCINARDAMPKGGRLRVSLDLVPHAAGPGPGLESGALEYVLLGVSDTGVGMTEDIKRRLFEPFFTTKQPGRGTGLGLATVRAVVQAHSGRIDVSSSPGEGSTFFIYLPVAPGVSMNPEPENLHCRIEGNGRYVVVAEDEPAVRETWVAYLERAGFRVLAASNGSEADAYLQDPAYDVSVAILDAVMPGSGGQQVLEAARARGQDLPIVFVTGYDYESLAGVVSQPGTTIMQKPFSSEALLALVSKVLKS